MCELQSNKVTQTLTLLYAEQSPSLHNDPAVARSEPGRTFPLDEMFAKMLQIHF